MKMAESSLKEKKTLWEKEKLLIMSNFSFSHSVFKRLVLQTRKNLMVPIIRSMLNASNQLLSQYSVNHLSHINPFPNKPWFLHVGRMSLLKTLREKKKIARNKQFLLFPQCFLPFQRTLNCFIKFNIIVYKLFQFQRV